MTTHEGGQAPVYELTVVGMLGPVLRDVLRPYQVTSTGHHTIMRKDMTDNHDLVDLVHLLDSVGLQIADVAVLERPR
jgi:hypothetical protein